MTEPDLTAAQQEAVRRMLASARHDEPMPDDVARRLDQVLAGLSAEHSGGASEPSGDAPVEAATADRPQASAAGADVVAIGSAGSARGPEGRSRSRRWPAYLLSAAAVVAIGFGVTQMIPAEDHGDSDSAGSAADSAQVNNAPSEGPQLDATRAPEAKEEAPPASTDDPQYAGRSLPLPDIAGLEPRRGPIGEDLAATKRSDISSYRLVQRCLPDAVPSGSQVRAASFRGRDAVVLYLPATVSGRPVEVHVCGADADQPVRSLTLPPEE